MKDTQKILAKRINSLCKKKGMSYYTLSYRSTVPLTTLLHILDGSTKNPGIFTVIKICEALNVSLTEFFGTDDFSKISRGVEE